MNTGLCSSCGEPIRWVVMPSGKRMPVDMKPQRLIVLDEQFENGSVRDCYTSHFASCPNAAQHRRKQP